MSSLLIVGDVLLDRDVDGSVRRLSADAPVPVVDDCRERVRPGGAGLAALLAARAGHQTVLVTALGNDDAGDQLHGLLTDAGVEVIDVRLAGATPEKVRVRGAGRTLLRLDRSSRGESRPGPATAAARAAVRTASAVIVADYGYGMAADMLLRSELAGRAVASSLVWDPHPRGPAPVVGACLVTPNRSEAMRLVPEVPGRRLAHDVERARRLVRRWGAKGVCITAGAEGATLALEHGAPRAVPAQAAIGDACGAGDCVAVAASGALANGASPAEAVERAVATASAFVAAGGLDAPTESRSAVATAQDAAAVIARVRRAGGTVVAAGGCFDLLHAGHVELLHRARELGDCLVVCMNADASVRRLKGPRRPVQGLQDRAAVLAALGCVDDVVVFDEDTPVAVLDRIRPDIWVKGGDYAVADLPEAAVLSSWGGRAVVLPFVAGRSTTRLIEEASLHAV
jgi:rfaE bifunctional protein nucleotidyltransferase chain/domain/rfaE bifunctional protein kinase chain/domain